MVIGLRVLLFISFDKSSFQLWRWHENRKRLFIWRHFLSIWLLTDVLKTNENYLKFPNNLFRIIWIWKKISEIIYFLNFHNNTILKCYIRFQLEKKREGDVFFIVFKNNSKLSRVKGMLLISKNIKCKFLNLFCKVTNYGFVLNVCQSVIKKNIRKKIDRDYLQLVDDLYACRLQAYKKIRMKSKN